MYVNTCCVHLADSERSFTVTYTKVLSPKYAPSCRKRIACES